MEDGFCDRSRSSLTRVVYPGPEPRDLQQMVGPLRGAELIRKSLGSLCRCETICRSETESCAITAPNLFGSGSRDEADGAVAQAHLQPISGDPRHPYPAAAMHLADHRAGLVGTLIDRRVLGELEALIERP